MNGITVLAEEICFLLHKAVIIVSAALMRHAYVFALGRDIYIIKRGIREQFMLAEKLYHALEMSRGGIFS